MAYSPSPNCMSIAAKAADGQLPQSEILDAFAELDAEKQRLEAEGASDIPGKIRKYAVDKAEAARIAAAAQKRFAARNILVRKQNDAHIAGFLNAGMRGAKALQAFVEGAGGTKAGAAGGRKSVWSRQEGGRNRYQGGLFAEIQENRPHLIKLFRDKDFDNAVTKEMHELRPDGEPGITGNDDATWLAQTFAKWQELSRTERNREGGAGIGKLAGRSSAQIHDDVKLVQAGKERWIGFIIGNRLLDVARSFGEGLSSTQVTRILGDMYDTIITGLPNKPTPAEMGQRVGPANLARSLGKHRVLHFRDADSAIMYRDAFGYGGTIAGVMGELGRAGDQLGLFQALGPNPKVMFASMAESIKRQIKENPNLTPEQKAQQSAEIDVESGNLRTVIDIAMGDVSRASGDGRWARIGENTRSVIRMNSLGGVALTSIPGDMAMTAIASAYRGSGFLKGLKSYLSGMLQGRPKGDQATIAYLGGEGYDGMISLLMGGRVGWDSATGVIAKGQDIFFRANFLTQSTDNGRSINTRMIQAELGLHADKTYGELYDAYRHVLSVHGIDEVRWDVLRQASMRQVNGKPYLTIDRVRELPDAAFEPLVRDRLAAARKAAGNNDANYAERAARISGDARRALEVDLAGFFADEVSYGVVTPDAATQRWTTWGGTRKGTFGGEMARFIMQFTATPIAILQRPLARMAFGQSKGWKHPSYYGHIAQTIGGMVVAGYMSIVMKDLIKGFWPPRDPSDPRTILAAIMQSGAAGIYGDYLFSQYNRFGRGVTETAVGPGLGTIADLIQIGIDARDYGLSGGENKFSAARAFSVFAGNIPFANLFYVKPVLDFLIVNAVRESLSPGYLRKQRTTRLKEYGQTRLPVIPERAF